MSLYVPIISSTFPTLLLNFGKRPDFVTDEDSELSEVYDSYSQSAC